MTQSKKKPATSIRYSDDVKNEVRDFVNAHNEKNKRGGVAAASKKYKITTVTITNWVKGPKKRKSTKAAPKAAAVSATAVKASKVSGKPRGRKPAAAKAVASSASPKLVLNRMVAIQDQIEGLNSEYDALLKQL